MAHTTPKYPEKVLRQLGLSSNLLIRNFLQEGKHQGELSMEEYLIFWRSLNGDPMKQTALFLKHLILELIEVLNKKKKPRYPTQALINTINFVALTFPFSDPKRISNQLSPTFKKWEENRAVYANNSEAGSSEVVIRFVSRRIMENKVSIESLVFQCASLRSPAEFQDLSDSSLVPTLHGTQFRSGEFFQVFTFLKRQASMSSSILREILDVCLIKMKTAPQQIKMSVKLSETFLLALIHMLKQFMSYWRLPDPSFAARAIDVLKSFYVWPSPCGEVTRDLLYILKTESLAPGNQLLQRFATESTVPKVLARKFGGGGQMEVCLPIFYLSDEDSQEARTYRTIMFLADNNEEMKCENAFLELRAEGLDENSRDIREMQEEVRTPGLSPKLMAMLLLSVIDYDVEVTQDDITNVWGLCADDVYTLFEHVVSLLHNAQQYATAEEAKIARIEDINKIKNMTKVFAQQNAQQQDFFPLRLPDTLPPSFVPPMPPIAHISINASPRFSWQEQESFSFAFPHSDIKGQLESLIRRFKYLADVNNPARLRICISGDDRLVHAVAIAYLQLKSDKDFLNGIDLQFFLIPFDDNHIASWIAVHDAWYNRHIYVPFRSPTFIMPHCRPVPRGITNMSHSRNDSIPAPAKAYRESITSFVREAQNVIQVQMFQAKAFAQGTTYNIPFCQRIEISSRVRDDSKNGANGAQCPVVITQMEAVDTMGILRKVFHDENTQYQSIVLANVPHPNDKCYPPNPQNVWLELYAAKGKDRNHPKDKKSSGDIKLHVTSITISSPQSMRSADVLFDVLIDGSVFGPFSQLIISPMVSEDPNSPSPQICLPLMTFFPFRSV